MAKKRSTTRKRTAKGNVTAAARKSSGIGKTGRFPIFDRRSAMSALKLIGHANGPSERASIWRRAAKYAPAAVTASRARWKKK